MILCWMETMVYVFIYSCSWFHIVKIQLHKMLIDHPYLKQSSWKKGEAHQLMMNLVNNFSRSFYLLFVLLRKYSSLPCKIIVSSPKFSKQALRFFLATSKILLIEATVLEVTMKPIKHFTYQKAKVKIKLQKEFRKDSIYTSVKVIRVVWE